MRSSIGISPRGRRIAKARDPPVDQLWSPMVRNRKPPAPKEVVEMKFLGVTKYEKAKFCITLTNGQKHTIWVELGESGEC